VAVFELQFAVPAFLDAQRARFRSERICPPAPIKFGSFSIQIQRLEFGANKIRRGPPRLWDIRYRDSHRGTPPQYLVYTDNDAEGFAVHIAQDVAIHTSSLEAIFANPNAAPPALANPIELVVVFELDYFPWPDGGCMLQFSANHVEWPVEPSFLGLPPEAVKAAVEELVPATFPARTVPFNFAPVVPPGFPEVANAGVSISGDLSVLAFRADPFGSISGNSDFPWTNFFSGSFTSRLDGSDWAMFTDSRMLCANIATQVEAAIRENPIPDTVLDAVSASFDVVAGVPLLTVHVGVYADVPVLGTTYFNFAIKCAISVETSPATLVFDIDLIDVEEQTNFIPLFVERLRLFPPPFGWFGWAIELAFADELSKLRQLTSGIDIKPSDFVCQKISDTRRKCKRPADVPAVEGLRLAVEKVSGYPDGLAINGSILGNVPPHGVLAVAPGVFAWSARRLSCNSPEETIEASRERPQDFAYLYLENELGVSGGPPTNLVHFCSLEIVNDPLDLYPKGAPGIVVQSDKLPTKLTVSMNTPPNLPTYPLDILVRTSAGVQLLRIPRPVAFAASDETLIAGAIKVQMLACPALPLWWGALEEGFNLDWIVDPLLDPDPQTIFGHFIELSVVGPAAVRTVAEIAESGGSLRKEITTVGEFWSVGAVVRASAKLSLQATRAGAAELDSSQLAKVELNLTPIMLRSTYHLEQRPVAIRLIKANGRKTALIVGERGVLMLDVSYPDAPFLVAVRAMQGVRGAAPVRDGAIVWTENELFALDRNLAKAPIRLRLPPVSDAVMAGSRLYLATESGIHLVDPIAWRPIGTVELLGPRALLAAHSRLFAGGTFGLASTKLSGGEVPRFESVAEGFEAVSLARGLGARHTVIARTSDEDEVEIEQGRDGGWVCARSRGEPQLDLWYADGDTLIFTVPGSQDLTIATLGAARPAIPVISRGNK
jgi:hypothetical protein